MTVNDTWIRTRGHANIGGLSTDVNLADIPLNDTLLRMHAGLTVIVELPGLTGPETMFASTWAAGIYTMLTAGGTTQNAISNSSDAAPPLLRWLWWESLLPVPQPVPNRAKPDTPQLWYLTSAQNPIDIKAQVRATTAISAHLAISTLALPSPFIKITGYFWASTLRSGL